MFKKLLMRVKLYSSSDYVRDAFSILQADPRISGTTVLSEFLDHSLREYLADAICILHDHPEISETDALLEFVESRYKEDWAEAIIYIDAVSDEGITSEQYNKLLNYYQGKKETRIGLAFRCLFRAGLLTDYCDEVLDWGATLDNDGFSRVIVKLYQADLLHLDNLETVLALPLLREESFSSFFWSISQLNQAKINHFAKICESGAGSETAIMSALQERMNQCALLPGLLRPRGNGSDSQKSRANIRRGARFIHQSMRTNGFFANIPTEVIVKIAAHCGEETQQMSEREKIATACCSRLGMS